MKNADKEQPVSNMNTDTTQHESRDTQHAASTPPLGVDTGGTFTDFVWLDETGRWHIHKQLSTPQDPSAAILAGLARLGVPGSVPLVHGSTVATNALLERRGARTALIATAGFSDVLAIGRQNRPDLYALVPQKPPPLVPGRWRFGVAERVTAQGEILQPLDPAGLPPILAQLLNDQIESVAICLLFAFHRPEHEQAIRDWLAARTSGLHFSLSSEILPEYREYERTATTVINAYVAPLMARYLQRLADGVAPRPVRVMQSNGGIISASLAGAQAARTVLSGPAGGVVGARFVAGQAGHDQIITFDMGGTSTDVALCPGRLPTTTQGEIGDLPLRLPIIDIHTVGAGGGSLAYVDAGGALHAGPQSAGANPGPACYNLPNAAPLPPLPAGPPPSGSTTTDANLVLGRLDAGHFLGGAMPLNLPRARAALAQLASDMDLATPELAAWGVIQVANATMERAIRRISVERGYDPRQFTLVAFGGAGPLHACELAERLQIPRVLVPAVPGVLSALGMLAAAPTKDYSQTVMWRVTAWDTSASARLAQAFAPLLARAQTEMAQEGIDPAGVVYQHTCDMRYAGQSHELTIPHTPGAELPAAFHAAHQRRYGYQRPAAAVEIVTIRLTAVAQTPRPGLTRAPLATPDAAAAVTGHKAAWFGQQPLSAALYNRELLRPGNQFSGPAIIFQYDTTTVLPPGWQANVDQFGNLLLRHH